MGNYWKGISDDDLVRAEVSLLKRAGLKTEDFNLMNIKLEDSLDDNVQIHQNYIHCVEILNKSDLTAERCEALPTMVLVHGYGAGGAVFYPVLKDLSLHFHIYLIDMLGMGSSGRPPFTAKSVEMAEDFFVNSIKQFIDMIGITKFFLVGHSLGGYIATVYALRHPEDVTKLLLLSPVGVPEKPQDFDNAEIVQRFDSFKGKVYAKSVLYLWSKNFTPFGPMRATGSWGTKAFINIYVKKRMSIISHEEELKEVKNYLHQIFLRPPSGEYAINTILSPGSWAQNPLFHRIQTLEVPVSFFYGE